MKFLLQKAEVDLKLPDNVEEYPASMLREALDWIEEIYAGAYQEVLSVRSLCKEEVWYRYEKWGDSEDLREVVLFNEALNKLKKATKKKPSLFKKGTNVTSGKSSTKSSKGNQSSKQKVGQTQEAV